MKKTFPLRTILTVTTGRLLTQPQGENNNGIGDLYLILEHMTGDPPFTHSLGRFAEDCKPELLSSFPELNEANTDLLDEMEGDPEWVETWLEMCVSTWGMKPEYEIGQIPETNHKHTNPLEELAAMIANDR